MNKVTQIILLHPKKFVCRSYEAFAKAIPISIYTLNEPVEFAYLIDELKPELVLIHEDLLVSASESYFTQISNSNYDDFKQVLIRSENGSLDSEIVNNFNLFLKEPYDLGDLENILSSLLAEHH